MNLRDIPARRAGQIHRRAARVHQQRQRQQLQVPMANNNQLYSDLKHIQVSPFTGASHENGRVWFEVFINKIECFNIPNARRVPLLKALLADKALTWWRSLPQAAQGDFNQLHELFLEEYVTGSNFTRMARKASFFDAKQAEGESVTDFYHRLLNSAAGLQIPDEDLLTKFVIGLVLPIHREVAPHRPQTLREAKERALDAEQLSARVSQTVPQQHFVQYNTVQNSDSQIHNLTKGLEALALKVEKLSERPRYSHPPRPSFANSRRQSFVRHPQLPHAPHSNFPQQRSGFSNPSWRPNGPPPRPQCFRCGRIGHIARQCVNTLN